MNFTETSAIRMLKSGKFQPYQVAAETGLSLTWVEMKAEQMGLLPLKVMKVEARKI